MVQNFKTDKCRLVRPKIIQTAIFKSKDTIEQLFHMWQ